VSYVIIDAKEFGALRERIKSGKLEKDDIRLLDLLIARAQQVAEHNSALGTMTVDRLPIGMDLVK
jgi:hypothetical protein